MGTEGKWLISPSANLGVILVTGYTVRNIEGYVECDKLRWGGVVSSVKQSLGIVNFVDFALENSGFNIWWKIKN